MGQSVASEGGDRFGDPLTVRGCDGRPLRGPSGSAVLLRNALFGDLLGVSRSVETDFMSILSIYPRIFKVYYLYHLFLAISYRTGQGHCNACHKKWGFTDNELCDCGEIQTMSHIVNSCPLTKFDGGLLGLHEADEAAVDWLTTYGS